MRFLLDENPLALSRPFSRSWATTRSTCREPPTGGRSDDAVVRRAMNEERMVVTSMWTSAASTISTIAIAPASS